MKYADSNGASGDLVFGLECSELVEIQCIAPFRGKTFVERVGLQRRRMVKRTLAAQQFTTLVRMVTGSLLSMATPRPYVLKARRQPRNMG